MTEGRLTDEAALQAIALLFAPYLDEDDDEEAAA
jgi:hypothetical protein